MICFMRIGMLLRARPGLGDSPLNMAQALQGGVGAGTEVNHVLHRSIFPWWPHFPQYFMHSAGKSARGSVDCNRAERLPLVDHRHPVLVTQDCSMSAVNLKGLQPEKDMEESNHARMRAKKKACRQTSKVAQGQGERRKSRVKELAGWQAAHAGWLNFKSADTALNAALPPRNPPSPTLLL